MMTAKQYEIYWVDLNPTRGSEMNKVRPCVIVSPDEMNNYTVNGGKLPFFNNLLNLYNLLTPLFHQQIANAPAILGH